MRKSAINLIGFRFGKLTVVSFSGRDKFGQLIWHCKCDCGVFCDKVGNRLRNGKTNSCGCKRAHNYIGKQIGYWIIFDEIKNLKCKKWLARCVCGSEKIVDSAALSSGKSSSCGCMNLEVTLERGKIGSFNGTHYLCKHPLYGVWWSMRNRCFNRNSKSFPFYGEKGISVCDEWKNSFIKFYDWAIKNGYKQGLSIERMNPKGNYCPENCEWITLRENSSRACRNKNIGNIKNGWRCCKKIPFTTQSIFECIHCGCVKQVSSYFGTSGKMKSCRCRRL